MYKRNITSSEKEYIGFIKINLDNGQSEYLKIYTYSDTDDLAYNFCLKHKLDFAFVKKLIEKINFIKENKISPIKRKEEVSFNVKNSNFDEDKENINLNNMNSFSLNGYDSNQKNFINNNLLNNLNDTDARKSNILNLNIFNNGIISNKEFLKENKNYSNENKKDKVDKINNNNFNINLDKSYHNHNPGNKFTNTYKNTKEIIKITIQKCMSILEKEENNDLDLLSSESPKNYLEMDKDYNSAPFCNSKSIINSKNHYNYYQYLTPDLNINESFNAKSIKNNINSNTFNLKSIEKENSGVKTDKKDLKLDEIKKENFKMEKSEEILISVPKNNYNIKNIKYFNKTLDNNRNSSSIPINSHKASNNLKKFNNICVNQEIEFSLISNKKNYLSFCPYINSNKNTESKKIIYKPKNIPRKFHIINNKLCHLHKNTISYGSQNKNNFLFFDNNKNNSGKTFNCLSLKTFPINQNENLFFSTLKTSTSISNCDLLSSNISEKTNNKQNRVTLMSNLNYSNIMRRVSKYKKLSQNKEKFNTRKPNKFNRDQKNDFILGNKILSGKQKQKEENIKYNQSFNNKTFISQNKISIKNNYKTIKKRNLMIFNIKNTISNDYSFKNSNRIKSFFSPKTKNIENLLNYTLCKTHNFYKTLKNFDKHYVYTNKIKEKLLQRNEILNCFRNIFIAITKNNKILDAFNMINKNNIQSPIYEIVKFIVKNCQNKNRFIEYEEFINKALNLFDNFSKEEKIAILNYDQYL